MREEKGETVVVSKYIVESSRSLAERTKEYVCGLKKGEETNFLLRHWALVHLQREEPPEIHFRVIKVHKDAMTRAIREAVKIENEGNMNAKNEWRLISRCKLKVEVRKWEQERIDKEERMQKQELEIKIEIVREKSKVWFEK